MLASPCYSAHAAKLTSLSSGASRTGGVYPVQGHSHKPEEIHLMIERVVGPGNYLELFARRPAPSRQQWDVWGNEVSSTVSLKEFGCEVPSDHGHDPTKQEEA